MARDMISCSSCGASLDEGEQFCPACGAAMPLPPMPELPPEFFKQEASEEPAPEPAPRSRPLVFLGVVAVVLVLAGGLYAFLDSPADPEPQPTAYAVSLPIDPAALAPVENAQPLPEATPSEKATLTAVVDKPSRIRPGLWRFETEIYDVTSTTLGNPINDISAFPLRQVKTAERCITPQVAAAPASVAFPVDPAEDCSVQQFSMNKGAYRASMRCAPTPGTAASSVEVGGDFDTDSARLTVHTSMMAADLSRKVTVDEPVVAHATLRGARIGACPAG